jgi:hypothetical protein
MRIETTNFDARELCSRKLWQLINNATETNSAAEELSQAINELASRRHYLAELANIGKLQDTSHKA